uniref:Uncharacterized protein n=1 Tax=Cyanothece sp. (strain PCC 7425 / ATCC 29141) TaxID=395961 RepID=B8HXQ3_CYAP4
MSAQVKERENQLKQQLRELKIELDQNKRPAGGINYRK